jgi:signal transduction histidine kinase
VADLLEFARQRAPVMDDVDVVQLLDEVLAVLPPPSGVTVDWASPTGPMSLRADRDMLRQVLLNLVSNAYQAMPDGGRLTVTAATGGGSVRISVADTGSGMTAEVREKLFEPFFTTPARGVGLGLAVCRQIVEAHSGEIVVSSEAGKGSEFRLVLPAISTPRSAVRDAVSEGAS